MTLTVGGLTGLPVIACALLIGVRSIGLSVGQSTLSAGVAAPQSDALGPGGDNGGFVVSQVENLELPLRARPGNTLSREWGREDFKPEMPEGRGAN